MLTLLAGKEIVQKLVTFKSMAADQLALAAIEIDLNDVPEGKVIFLMSKFKKFFIFNIK